MMQDFLPNQDDDELHGTTRFYSELDAFNIYKISSYRISKGKKA